MSKWLIGGFAGLALGAALTREALASPGVDPAVKASCVKLYERERACTDAFIPALVDARVALDRPAGIAARAKREGRDALISAARSEWASDSEDSAIGETCDEIASSPRGAELAAAGAGCAKQVECGVFVACVMPVLRDNVLRR